MKANTLLRQLRALEDSRLLLQIFIEPRQRALQSIRTVRRVAQAMSFAGIDHDRGRNVHRLQRVPELLRLRRGAFDVVFAHVLECRSLDVADEIDRG